MPLFDASQSETPVENKSTSLRYTSIGQLLSSPEFSLFDETDPFCDNEENKVDNLLEEGCNVASPSSSLSARSGQRNVFDSLNVQMISAWSSKNITSPTDTTTMTPSTTTAMSTCVSDGIYAKSTTSIASDVVSSRHSRN
jgi:hypothetical protein